MTRTLVLVNPAAGGGRSGRRWRALESRLGDAEVLAPASADEARRQLAARLEAGGVERLVSVGGDGTAHLAVNALLAAGRGADVALGLVPAGTGSDFARCLGLPRGAERALGRALDPAPARPVDAIELVTDDGERRFCLNVASAGLSGAVDEAVEAGRRRGGGSYLGATVSTLLRYGAVACRVEADGELLHDGDLFLVALANGRFFGQGMPVAPGAEVDDGLLDVVVVPPIPKWQMPWRLPAFLAGRHVRWPEVTVRRAREVRLEPATTSPPYDLDGETRPAVAATFRVLPAALRVLA